MYSVESVGGVTSIELITPNRGELIEVMELIHTKLITKENEEHGEDE